jgi:hypothetical protein
LEAVRVKNYQIVCFLKDKYEPSIRRDPNFKAYLAHLEKKYFGVEPPREGGLGALLNLFT